MHTIIPAPATKDGLPVLGFGVMGGHYQPVGQVHVLTNLLDFGQDPQAAIDAPRAFAYARRAAGRARRAGGDRRRPGQARPPRGAEPKPLGGGQMIMVDHAAAC